MEIKDNCVFCGMVAGTVPHHKIWENENYMAFLSNRPNTEGFTVVITKEHYPSYVFELPADVMNGLVAAAKEVALLLDDKLDDVGRTGMIAEGFGIDHAHLKLFPMHGTRMSEWKPITSNVDKFFPKYEGYVSSHAWKLADDRYLAELAKKIRE